MKKNLLTILLLCLTCALYGNSQIKYQSGKSLSLGCEPDPNYGITINGLRGINFNGSSLLYVDFEHTFIYMRGSGWAVYFYNAETKTYNDIRAMAIRNHANGEIYDSWIDDEEDGVLRALNPVSYVLKTDTGATPANVGTNHTDVQRHIGFIAQEVERIMPETVSVGAEGKKAINYTALLPVVVKSIKQLNRKSQDNRARIDAIKKMINAE